MRSPMPLVLVLAALFCVVGADWFRWSSGDGAGSASPDWMPQETSDLSIADSAGAGWTPKPTPPPSAAKPEGEQVLDILLQRDQVTTNWTNDKTCGWMPGVPSDPWTCADGATCATNYDHIVACVSGTYSPFYSVCLDYAAYQSGSCVDNNEGTGCCTNSRYGSCATYFWTDKPMRSMYRCYNASVAVTMLEAPQYVVDASLASLGSGSAARTTQSSEPPAPGAAHPDSNQNEGAQATDTSTRSVNVAVIVGAALGGFTGLLLLGFAALSCRACKEEVKKDHDQIRARLDSVYQDPPHFTPGPSSPSYPASTAPSLAASTPYSPSSPDPGRGPSPAYAPVPGTPSRTPRRARRSRVRRNNSNSANRASAPADYASVPTSPQTPETPGPRSASARNSTATTITTPVGRSRRSANPPSYEWYLMYPLAEQQQQQEQQRQRSETPRASAPRDRWSYSTPPPRYSPFPRPATPHDALITTTAAVTTAGTRSRGRSLRAIEAEAEARAEAAVENRMRNGGIGIPAQYHHHHHCHQHGQQEEESDETLYPDSSSLDRK